MKVFGSSYVSTKTKFKRVVNALSICIKRCKLVAVALFIISWQDEREHCRWFIDCQLGWSVGGDTARSARHSQGNDIQPIK